MWDVHVLRNEGNSRGIATIIFDDWTKAESFKRDFDRTKWGNQVIKVKWDRDWTEIQEKGGLPGEYPINLNDRERKTVVIGGIAEGAENGDEEELAFQEEIVRRGMDSKNLRSWRAIKWIIKSWRRMGRKEDGKTRLLAVTFDSKMGADKVYHSRITGKKSKVWIRRYRTRKMQSQDRLVKILGVRRWKLKMQNRRQNDSKELTLPSTLEPDKPLTSPGAMQQPRNPLRKIRSDAQRLEAPPPPVKEAIDHGKNESEEPKPPYQQQKQEQQSQSQQHQDMGQLDKENNQNFKNQASQESDRKLEPISDKLLTKTDQSRIEQYLQSRATNGVWSPDIFNPVTSVSTVLSGPPRGTDAEVPI